MSLWIFFPSQGNLKKWSKIFLSKYLFSLKLFITFFSEKGSIFRRDRLLQSCGMCRHLLHLPPLDCGWRYRCLCIYLAQDNPSLTPSTEPVWYFHFLFPLSCRDTQHPQKEHYLSVQGSCPFTEPTLGRSCAVPGGRFRAMSSSQTPNPPFPCLISLLSEHSLSLQLLGDENPPLCQLMMVVEPSWSLRDRKRSWQSFLLVSKVPVLRSPAADIAQCCCDSADKTFGATFLCQIKAKYLSKGDQVGCSAPKTLLNSLPQDLHHHFSDEFCWPPKAPEPQTMSQSQDAAGKLRGIWWAQAGLGWSIFLSLSYPTYIHTCLYIYIYWSYWGSAASAADAAMQTTPTDTPS